MIRAARGYWAAIALLGGLGCRPEPQEPLSLHLEVRDARPTELGEPVENVEATLSRRALSGGVLVGAYTDAAAGGSDAAGICDLTFDRVNALDYRLDLRRDGWFSERLTFPADDFQPGEPRNVIVEMMPRAEVVIQIAPGGPTAPGDQVQFRTLTTLGPWVTCSPGFLTLTHLAPDSTWTCSMPGDSYIHYQYTVTREGETTPVLDSLWLPAWEETLLQVSW